MVRSLDACHVGHFDIYWMFVPNWENMEKMNSAEQIIKVRSHNDTEGLGGPKLKNEVTRSVFIQEVTAEMKNLKEEIVCIKDEIKQIKCDREKELARKGKVSEDLEHEQDRQEKTCISAILVELIGEMKSLKNGVVNLEGAMVTMKTDRELEIQENVVIPYRNKSKQNGKRGNKAETVTFTTSGLENFKSTYSGFENQITAIQNADIIRENLYEWYMLWPNKDKQESRKGIEVNEDDWDIVRSTYERLIRTDRKALQKQAFAYEKETELNQRLRTLLIENATGNRVNI